MKNIRKIFRGRLPPYNFLICLNKKDKFNELLQYCSKLNNIKNVCNWYI